VTDEVDLFKKLEIDVLVLKNSGGDSSKAKLKAANILKIPVIMLVRPNYSGINSVNGIYQCLKWVGEVDKNRK
jgi:precorrin-6A/cobalt-precorrin-6A reductase